MADVNALARRSRRESGAARVGDWALCFLWAAQGTIGAIRAVRHGMDGDYLGATNIGVIAAVFFAFGVFFVLRSPTSKRSIDRGSTYIALVGTWSIVILSVLPLTWRPDWLLTATTLALIAAYCWVLWAVLTLRRNLSIFPEARELIRHGPYGLVRHPLYSAHVVCYLLIAIPRFSILAVLLAVLGIAGELMRARSEERLLESVFGAYASYADSTPRFLPRFRLKRTTLLPAAPISSPAVELT